MQYRAHPGEIPSLVLNGDVRCLVCTRLWEHFERAHYDLLRLVEKKPTEARIEPAVDRRFRVAAESRRCVKELVLPHYSTCGDSPVACNSCRGAGRWKQYSTGFGHYIHSGECRGCGTLCIQRGS